MEWFYLALLAPLLFALTNLFDDNLIRGGYKSPYFATILTSLFSLLPLLSLVFIAINIPSIPIVLLAITSGILTSIFVFLYFKALLIEEPSVIIALFNISPAIVPIFAFLFLKEIPTILQIIAFIIILVASFLISAVDIKHFKLSKAIYLITIAAVLNATVAIMNKMVFDQTDFWSGFILYSLGVGIGGLLFWTIFKEGQAFIKDLRKVFKKYFLTFLLIQLLALSAEITLNYAISLGPVSSVKIIEGTQPIFVLLLAIIFYPVFPKYLREATHNNKTRKLLLMLVTLFGLYLLYK